MIALYVENWALHFSRAVAVSKCIVLTNKTYERKFIYLRQNRSYIENQSDEYKCQIIVKLFGHALIEEKKITTTAGFEPARAKPKRFLIFLLNHSDKLPYLMTLF